jgi:hypothetical protein
MITVGLVKELAFMSEFMGQPLHTVIILPDLNFRFLMQVANKKLLIYHKDDLIWEESLDETTGNFGIESCQQIVEIFRNKCSGKPYEHLIHREKS